MNDPAVNSPIGVRPDYSDVQCDDVLPRVGIDSEGPDHRVPIVSRRPVSGP